MTTVELIIAVRESNLDPEAKAELTEMLENWAEENL